MQIGRPALSPPGDARLDWQVICDLSNRIGYPMDYSSPSCVFDEFTSLAPSYQGLSYDNLGLSGKIWPCPDPNHSLGETVLFHDGFPTPSGRGKFVPAEFAEADDLPGPDYPLVLNTGRVLEHWHTGTMTRRAQALDAISPGPFVEVHPQDLTSLEVADGETVTGQVQ